MSEGQTEGTSLERVWRILRRRVRLVLICAVVMPAAAYGFASLQEKEYTAEASLLFRDPGFDEQLLGTPVSIEPEDSARAAETNLALVSLRVVADRTARRLGGGTTGAEVSGKVRVESGGSADLVSVTATESEPRRARRLANEFGREYIRFRRDSDRAKIGDAQALLERQLAALPPERQDSDEAASLRQRAERLEVLAALQTGNAELVQPANTPTGPTSPRPRRSAAIGLAVGIFLGLGLALLADRLDRRLTETRDVEDAFERPVLGLIPDAPGLSVAQHNGRLPTPEELEAFRMVRANLRYFQAQRPIRSVLITSPGIGDGKTTVAWNLALAAATAGERVLLVEADLRRPSLDGRLLDSSPGGGLSAVLAGNAEAEDVIQAVELQQPSRSGDKLDVLVAGPIPPNPTDLMGSERMERLLDEAERRYELVVIDTPPASLVSDPIPLFGYVSGVLVVTRLRWSTRDAAARLRQQLIHLDAPTLGVVINAVPRSEAPRGYYQSEPD